MCVSGVCVCVSNLSTLVLLLSLDEQCFSLCFSEQTYDSTPLSHFSFSFLWKGLIVTLHLRLPLLVKYNREGESNIFQNQGVCTQNMHFFAYYEWLLGFKNCFTYLIKLPKIDKWWKYLYFMLFWPNSVKLMWPSSSNDEVTEFT